ncbi:MAG TPA: DUF169 domain-containing protein [Acidobacteriaceae bacterium]|jgi:uncharacterized protein (DUF169 family)|nr:DUF169 domain-containing protein [Acidobacteriaceae bacterium]
MTMTSQGDYRAIADTLSASLHLQQPPVAISFCDTVPGDVPAHSGHVAAGCRFWEDGAAAAFATSAVDHNRCAIGVYTHNLQPSPEQQTDLMDALKVFADLGYVREADLPQIPVLQTRPRHVVYSPLARTAVQPDVVLLFVNSNQTLILSEATQQVENEVAPAMGRPACAVVPQVMNTGRAALSLGCCGARAYLDVLRDDGAIFAIPGAKLTEYTERIEVLSKANALLSRFHQIRRRAVEDGSNPTIKDSLAALSA